MSEPINDGGPAFPGPTDRYGNGMSLRDYFAGQALAGLLADPDMRDTPERFSGFAYELADAMLAARDGGK